MNIMMRWTLFFAILMLVMNPSHSYTIAQKGRVSGPSIHTTYFLTPNNAGFDVRATALPGKWLNGSCVYAAQYSIGQDFLTTGDFVDLDAFRLKSIIGSGYSCLTIYYFYSQPVIDTVQLVWDGFNYSNTVPATSEVTVL
jgi:hypothetical protein